MKTRRDIILDFTSLLDVIMIILFYFILFSHFEVSEAKKEMEDAKNDAETAVSQADERERLASDQYQKSLAAETKVQQELDRLRDQAERSVYDYSAMQEFESGSNLKMHLVLKRGVWQLYIFRGETGGAVALDGQLTESLRRAFVTLGYTEDSTILCDFAFDADEPGTKTAYEALNDAFLVLRREYRYLYISENDESKRRRMENE